MAHPVICRKNLNEVLKEWQGKIIDNGECARLVQVLCPEIGWTGRWERGPRVVEVLSQLSPGTAIANFVHEQGSWKFPSRRGWHAGIFKQDGRHRPMPNGLPCAFTLVDQWPGQTVEERGLPHATPELVKRHPLYGVAANNADEFYVILVP